MKWRKGRSEKDDEKFAFEEPATDVEPPAEEALAVEEDYGPESEDVSAVEEDSVSEPEEKYGYGEEPLQTEPTSVVGQPSESRRRRFALSEREREEPATGQPMMKEEVARPQTFKRRRTSWAEEERPSRKSSRIANFLELRWLRAHWKTIVILLFIFGFALFVRGYYGWDPATKDGFLLSGGSDSYYHNWVTDHMLDTGQHRFWENMLNYPVGTRNPRPPLYDWSIGLGGIALNPFISGDLEASMFTVFLFSTAFWGALTIFPAYFLAREAFGRKAGIVAAFLLAIMPGHVTRSVLSNADHDAMALFFIVTSFYFFLRALKKLEQRQWVQSWRRPKEALGSVREMVMGNRIPILYALMASFSIISVALIWKGYAYVIVILTVYFFIQVLINRFRGTDSLAVLMVFAITVGVTLLLIFPYYYLSIQIASWYDAPVVMFFAASVFALILIVTHRYPWVLVFSFMIMVGVAAVLFLYVFVPSLLDMIVSALSSGAGYFVSNKQYQTIAEAQAPPFSNLALSFGIITFWLSFVGVAWAAIQLPKNMKADFIFILIWTATSIYMAVTAARFMFNAAPAFAITAGWVVAILIDKLSVYKFSEQLKRFSRPKLSRGFKFGLISALAFLILVSVGLSGSVDLAMGVLVIGITALVGALMMNLIAETNPKRMFHLATLLVPLGGALFYLYTALGTEWQLTVATHGFILFAMIFIYFILYLIVRRTKFSFTAGVIFLAFFIVVPNVWAGLDAGIPYETKRIYDEEVYDVMPVFMQPPDYANQSNWFIGGFGFSLPLNNRYWPATYDWLATQDKDVYPAEDKPAFLSWWDYGFEVVNEGKHPTVADNFLGGHQLAGNFIMAQSEKDAIALLCSRLIEGNWHGEMQYGIHRELSDNVKNIISSYGLNLISVEDMLNNPSDYIDEIKAHPEIFGPRDDIIQPENARYLAIRGHITQNLEEEQVAALYHDLREATGDSIRYFAIDSRMFPFSADNTGIFYAPAKLSDHRIDELGNQPYDFWVIKAVSDTGAEYDIDEVPPDVKLNPDAPYKLVYQEMFFNTMLYKTFIGISPMDLGQEMNVGIPGLSGDVASEAIMPGWNMTHFKLEHRTAYWNPYPGDEVRNHTDAWQAMNYRDAQVHQQSGEGVADLSDRSSLYQGVMMLKYYDGAIISGTVTLEDGTPVYGARVTVSDDFGIPHNVDYSDENGKYSVIAPFGDVGVTVSAGADNPRTLIGGELYVTSLHIEDYQAMRSNEDRDNNGRPDYLINLDPVIQSGNLSGILFWDSDGNGQKGENEPTITGARLVLENMHLTMTKTHETNETGVFNITGIAPGDHTISVYLAGRLVGTFDPTITSGQNLTEDFAAVPIGLTGMVSTSTGEAASGVTVTAWIPGEDIVAETTTEATGNYTFENLLHGNYSVQASSANMASTITMYTVEEGGNNTLDLMIYPSALVSGKVRIGSGTPVATNTIRFLGTYDMLVRTDEYGEYTVKMPLGQYDVSCEYVKGLNYYVNISQVLVDGDKGLDISLDKGSKVYGQAFLADGLTARNVEITFEDIDSGAILSAHTNNQGVYTITLPRGVYRVQSLSYINNDNWTHYSQMNFESSTELDITLRSAKVVKGTIYWQQVSEESTKQGIPGAQVMFRDTTGQEYVTYTIFGGMFQALLYPKRNYVVTIQKEGFQPLSLGTQTSEALASDLLSEYLSPISIPVSGTVLLNDLPIEDSNLIVHFQSTNVITESIDVQIYRDGTYSVDLQPGEYTVSFSHNVYPGNDTVKIEITEPFEFNTDYYTGSPLILDLEGRLRVKTHVTVLSPTPVASTVSFKDGPEPREFTVQNGTGTFYLMPGNYTLAAYFAENTSYLVGMVAVNITESVNQSVTVSLEEGIELRGLLTYMDQKVTFKEIDFFDSISGGRITAQTDAAGEYDTILVPDRNYTVSVDFVDFADEAGFRTAYRYFYLETLYASQSMSSVMAISLLREDYYTEVSGKIHSDGTTAEFADIVFLSDFGKEAVTAKDDGSFSVKLRSGNHSVYVHYDPSDRVYLGYQYFGVKPTEGLIIDLIPGLILSGTTYFNLDQHKVTHLNFTSALGRVEVLSDANGFYEVWLPAGSYNVTGGATNVEHGLDVAYELDMAVELETDLLFNLPMSMIEEVGIELNWDSKQKVSAEPGDTVTYTVRVRNTGNVRDTFVLGGSGANPGWVFTYDPVELTLNPGKTGSSKISKVSFTVPDQANSDEDAFTVTAVSSRSDVTSSITLEIDVIQTYSFELEKVPSGIPTFDKGVIFSDVHVKNTGNGQDKLTVMIANVEELRKSGWEPKIILSEDSVGELAHDTMIVNMTISSRDVLTVHYSLTPYGDTQSRIINVLFTAHSQNDVSPSASKVFTLVYPVLNPYAADVSIYGDSVYDQPTGSEAANAGVMVVTVAAALILFYVARKKRWLR